MMEARYQAIPNSEVCCHVNTKLLPLKIHFFFTFGAIAGVFPFLPVIAKELGINAMAVGIGYSILPIFMLFSDPIIGLLMDYFQNLKIFLITILLTCSLAYSSVLCLPPITYEADNLAYIQISDINNLQTLINVSTPFQKSCLVKILDSVETLGTDIRCTLELEDDTTETNSTYLPTSIDITYSGNNSRGEPRMDSWIVFYTNDSSSSEIKDKIKAGRIFQCSTTFQQCALTDDSKSVFYTYQFWLFFTFIVIGGIAWNSTMHLSSVACYEALSTQIEAYGNQRLFGTISSGIISSLAGIFNDLFISDKKSFLSGFYLMAVMMVISIINLSFINIPKSGITKSKMLKNIGKILNAKEIIVFALGTVFVGIFASTISLYEFWFLEDMGANRTLFGLAIAMQCLLGEAPFLFFTGWLVNKLGYFLCFASVFAGFAVRFLLYSILRDPWLVLPIDMLHGITFGLFHGAWTSFAKVKAPRGMEATLMGFFGGMYDGLGYGIGSLMSGYGVDTLGPRLTFFIASMISVGCLLLFLVAGYLLRNSNEELEVTKVETEEIDEKE